jgi:leucyl-tRNA synthetase
MVAPVAPHIAEELWERLGHQGGVTYVPFPEAEPSLLVEETVTCVIQIRGKVRDRVEVATTISEDELRALVLSRDKVVAATPHGVRTVIVRAPKLVNVVPV